METVNVKKVILCADDYGLNTSISQGIIKLLEGGTLSAVSILSSAPGWSDTAPWLKAYQGKVDLGLHFNLTEGKALSSLYQRKERADFYPLPQLILRAFAGLLDAAALEAECEAQLLAFKDRLGFWPDFIDGHQHIHQLPQVRDALLRVYQRTFSSSKPYIRSVRHLTRALTWMDRIKAMIISSLGARVLERKLKAAAIPFNTVFSGVYSFDRSLNYAQLFPGFLAKIQNGGLIMCHPALTGQESLDEHAKARFEEYRYLSSGQFHQHCQEHSIQVVRGYLAF